MTLSPLKITPSPPEPVMPMSASFASPGPFTTQPITATFMFFFTFLRRLDTSFAIVMRSIEQRAQVGQETSFAPPCVKFKDERIDFASKLVEIADKEGISREKLFFDIAVQSSAMDSESALLSLATIKAVKGKFTGVKTTCGLSNASFGLPKRVNINSAYLTCAVYNGLDSAIMDNTNAVYEMTIKAAEVIAGRDEYCMEYITYIRENQ